MTRAASKARGAFYTPPELARGLADEAIVRRSDRVIEPAAGRGVFALAAADALLALGARRADVRTQLVAVELHQEDAATTTAAVAARIGARWEATCTSFFGLIAEPVFDAVIGNPPFVRYQGFKGAAREAALACARKAGVELSGLASAWAAFVVHAVAFLRDGGRLAMILPAELLRADYAAPVRAYLCRSFARVEIAAVADLFPGTQERVVRVVCRGRGEPFRQLVLRAGAGEHALHGPGSDAAAGGRWYLDADAADGEEALAKLRSAGALVPLRKIGGAALGLVTGANGFFVRSASAWRAAGIRPDRLRPVAPGASLIRGPALEIQDLSGHATLIWDPGPALRGVAESRLVAEGEAAGIDGRYKCRVRDPWWAVPGLSGDPPAALLTLMADTAPRIAVNEARALPLNSLLGVHLGGVEPHLLPAWIVAFYNSATLLSAEREGRSYGGGILKLEPRDAGRMLVPAPGRVEERQEALRALWPALVAAEGRWPAIQALLPAVDAALLPSAEEQAAAARARQVHARAMAARRGPGRKNGS